MQPCIIAKPCCNHIPAMNGGMNGWGFCPRLPVRSISLGRTSAESFRDPDYKLGPKCPYPPQAEVSGTNEVSGCFVPAFFAGETVLARSVAFVDKQAPARRRCGAMDTGKQATLPHPTLNCTLECQRDEYDSRHRAQSRTAFTVRVRDQLTIRDPVFLASSRGAFDSRQRLPQRATLAAHRPASTI